MIPQEEKEQFVADVEQKNATASDEVSDDDFVVEDYEFEHVQFEHVVIKEDVFAQESSTTTVIQNDSRIEDIYADETIVDFEEIVPMSAYEEPVAAFVEEPTYEKLVETVEETVYELSLIHI